MREWSRFTCPELVARRDAAPLMLHCMCCHEVYERGHFRCCAPPAGLASHVWSAKFCLTCEKCPTHCHCVMRRERGEP